MSDGPICWHKNRRTKVEHIPAMTLERDHCADCDELLETRRAAASAPVEVERAARAALDRILTAFREQQRFTTSQDERDEIDRCSEIVERERAALRATPGGGEQPLPLDHPRMQNIHTSEGKVPCGYCVGTGERDATPAEPAGCTYVYRGESMREPDYGTVCGHTEAEHAEGNWSHPFQSEPTK